MADDRYPDGLIVVVKRDCPTCVLVEPVLAELNADPQSLTVYTQDDLAFPAVPTPTDDRELRASYELGVTIVPTLIRRRDGAEVGRAEGWERSEWVELSGVASLGAALPQLRPGCGSLSVEPRNAERLAARHGNLLHARRVEFGDEEDPFEALYARGWSDGLPVIPPTPERVVRMLAGTTRDPQEVIATVPPNLAPCSVEKVAVNAVMAGCLPEYLPVVLAAVEAACSEPFAMHGLLATTMPHGPVVIANGPYARRIGINSGGNALGQGHRANATIGRALNLVVRNVGGGRPGEVDRSCLGSPAKVGMCFAEAETDSPWESLAVERGFAQTASTVTVFAGEGPRVVVDQLSRDPESLVTSFAQCMKTQCHPKLPLAFDTVLVVSPEHARVFREAGWDKTRLRAELGERLMLAGEDIVRGAHGMAEGVPAVLKDATLPKFRPEGILIVHAGGGAGLFSAIIGGWVNGEMGSNPVTMEVRE